jgi:predicted XRE-type DNA-binding protein
MSPEIATIQALRGDLALQIARSVAETGETQVAAARRLGIPQPTLSKIVRGSVGELSLELLIRIAVRAGLQLVLHTGKDPAEAGVFVSRAATGENTRTKSRVSEEARRGLAKSVQMLTPEERLEAHVRHSELLAELNRAGRAQRERPR